MMIRLKVPGRPGSQNVMVSFSPSFPPCALVLLFPSFVFLSLCSPLFFFLWLFHLIFSLTGTFCLPLTLYLPPLLRQTMTISHHTDWNTGVGFPGIAWVLSIEEECLCSQWWWYLLTNVPYLWYPPEIDHWVAFIQPLHSTVRSNLSILSRTNRSPILAVPMTCKSSPVSKWLRSPWFTCPVNNWITPYCF